MLFCLELDSTRTWGEYGVQLPTIGRLTRSENSSSFLFPTGPLQEQSDQSLNLNYHGFELSFIPTTI